MRRGHHTNHRHSCAAWVTCLVDECLRQRSLLSGVRETFGHLVERLPDVCRDGLVAGVADESFPGMDGAGRWHHGVLETLALSCERARVRRRLSSFSQVDGPPTGRRICSDLRGKRRLACQDAWPQVEQSLRAARSSDFGMHDSVPSRGSVTSCALARSAV